MPILSDKGIGLLGTFTGSIATGANPTLYTTPIGKVTRITHVVFRDPSASAAAATSLSVTSFRQTFSIANLITANTGYLVVQATDLAQYTEIAAGTAVVLTTTTGAAVTVTVDVFGYTT
ncbi:MAG TPA: hypothetical protein VI729_05970 [Anaerolineales bacterium]|nr:hypothetical protein [Anaerolineales bacterium]